LHPNKEQERLWEIFWTTAQEVHGGRAPSGFPARTTSHEQDAQSQRRSAFERLGPNESQNWEKRRDNNQSNQIKRLREEGSRTSHHSPLRFIPRTNNNWPEEGAESKHREVRTHDRFPCFSRRLASIRLPHKFKPSNHSKYNGKTEPK
jgi:hypothetical protein